MSWRLELLHVTPYLHTCPVGKKIIHLHDVANELGPRPNEVRKIPPLTTVGATAGPLHPMDQDDYTHGCNSVSLRTPEIFNPRDLYLCQQEPEYFYKGLALQMLQKIPS